MVRPEASKPGIANAAVQAVPQAPKQSCPASPSAASSYSPGYSKATVTGAKSGLTRPDEMPRLIHPSSNKASSFSCNPKNFQSILHSSFIVECCCNLVVKCDGLESNPHTLAWPCGMRESPIFMAMLFRLSPPDHHPKSTHEAPARA